MSATDDAADGASTCLRESLWTTGLMLAMGPFSLAAAAFCFVAPRAVADVLRWSTMSVLVTCAAGIAVGLLLVAMAAHRIARPRELRLLADALEAA